MSTVINSERGAFEVPELRQPESFVCAIVAARWNSHITDALLKGATDTLKSAGVKEGNIRVIRVPGTVELTYGANMALDFHSPDAVIVIGCVLRGETPHFDSVCSSVTQGITTLNTEDRAPVIFGVLTVDNEQQALDRAGGRLGNKGAEAAAAAIEMANLRSDLIDRFSPFDEADADFMRNPDFPSASDPDEEL